jgi:hypothetical protein
MQLPMVATAERHGELIADFETQGSGLSKAQMMAFAIDMELINWRRNPTQNPL